MVASQPARCSLVVISSPKSLTISLGVTEHRHRKPLHPAGGVLQTGTAFFNKHTYFFSNQLPRCFPLQTLPSPSKEVMFSKLLVRWRGLEEWETKTPRALSIEGEAAE